MQKQFENMQKQFCENRAFSQSHFETAVSNLKTRLQKITSFDDVSPILSEDTAAISLIEVLVLRDQAKQAAGSEN